MNSETVNSAATVFIVDDEPEVLDMLSTLVAQIGLKPRTFGSARAFLEAYEPGMAGCLLTDIRMPGMTGLELQQVMAERSDPLPIIVMSGHADVATTVRVMKAGATNLLEKGAMPQQLLQAVADAVELDRQQRLNAAVHADVRTRLDSLTPRETDVLKQLIRGLSSKAIAAELSISVNTVEVHRARIIKKMNVDSSLELVRLCLDAGLAPAQKSA